MYCDIIFNLQGAKVVASGEQRESFHLRRRGHVIPIDLEDTISCLQNTLPICDVEGERGRDERKGLNIHPWTDMGHSQSHTH